MLSDYIAKFDKARIYASEPQRFKMVTQDSFIMTGRHHDHTIRRNGRGWECSCAYFRSTEPVYHCCAHIMALERIINLQTAVFADSPAKLG
jgi:hypothetical protein